MASAKAASGIDLPGGNIPILGFGTWQIQGNEAYQSVRDAIEVGYRHIDTATVYQNESQVGRALEESGVARRDLFVTTKLPPDQNRATRDIFAASLEALRTDYVDLWLIHWTPRVDSAIELWRAMVEIHQQGHARAIGVSNFSLDDIDQLTSDSGVCPAVNQIRWSPFLYDPNEVDGLQSRGVILEGYSPFQASRLDAPALIEIANAHNVTPPQVILRWHVQHGVVVIPKSTHRERIEENFAIFDFVLNDQEMKRIDQLA